MLRGVWQPVPNRMKTTAPGASLASPLALSTFSLYILESMTARTPITLERIYAGDRVVVTAHRGLSGRYPENTLLAFDQAVRCGADIVEFDVRETADGVPVILHDPTVDRTTDGHGPVSRFRWADLKLLNASYWSGPHDTGKRLNTPAQTDARIPSLEDTLSLLAGKIAMNIQVYTVSERGQEKIVELLRRFWLHDSAFLMVNDFTAAAAFRRLKPALELCVGEARDNPRRHRDFGLRLIQPYRAMVGTDYCREVQDCGLWANLFYTNTPDEFDRYFAAGLKGVLTDNAERLIAYLRSKGKRSA